MLLALFALSFSGNRVMATEEPAFQTIMKDGAFEIRDYPSLIVAEVTVGGDRRAAANEGFRLLAGYIFGGNISQQRSAMTAPVAQAPVSEKIAMTAPVMQTGDTDRWVIQFTMPSEYSLETLPQPTNPRVKLLKLPPQQFAVRRFSGRAGSLEIADETNKLLATIEKRGLRVTGAVTVAQYNAPWVPGFARRNEVLLPIER